MAGLVGQVPYRSGDLSRERDAKKSARGEIRKGTLKDLYWYDCPENWHPSVKAIWYSVPESGIYEYYQNTDLAMLYALLEDLDRAKKKNGTPPAMLLNTLYTQLNGFGFSEGDRRRMRIELEAEPTEDPIETRAVSEYQDALNVTSIETKRAQ